jgi:hypothetical protein
MCLLVRFCAFVSFIGVVMPATPNVAVAALSYGAYASVACSLYLYPCKHRDPWADVSKASHVGMLLPMHYLPCSPPLPVSMKLHVRERLMLGLRRDLEPWLRSKRERWLRDWLMVYLRSECIGPEIPDKLRPRLRSCGIM